MSLHIKRKHRTLPEVSEALKLPPKDRKLKFAMFKREGIINYNISESKKSEPNYQSERISKKQKNVVMCKNCKKMISSRYFGKHEKKCGKTPFSRAAVIPVHLIGITDLDEKFKTDVVSKFRIDQIGSLCRKDEGILKIGEVFYRSIQKKKDKKQHVKKFFRLDMRRLARLYILFSNEDVSVRDFKDSRDMFLRRNFESLREAISKCCGSGDNVNFKPGLKQNLLFLIKRAAKVLKCLALEKDNENFGEEIDRFTNILYLWEDLIFGDATYELNKRRQTNLRKPGVLPDEEDVKALRNETLRIMGNTKDISDENIFVKLRDATCTRLTLLNGRRGKIFVFRFCFFLNLIREESRNQ